uniref:Uncharacterized protein n=3 Tax=Tetraselmis sp. GSL018 TaxID=582737 RepID=A0A061SLU3_9CHLO
MQEKMENLVKKAVSARSPNPPLEKQPPPREEAQDKAAVAKVVHRCMDAPAPWMPRPLPFRSILETHRKKQVVDKSPKDDKSPKKVDARPDEGVKYIEVPKHVEKTGTQKQWVSRWNSHLLGEALTKQMEVNSGISTNRRTSNTVSIGSRVLHIPRNLNRGLHPSHHGNALGRSLLENLGEESSFCGDKDNFSEWRRCLAQLALDRCQFEEKESNTSYSKELGDCVRNTDECRLTHARLQHMCSHLEGIGTLALSKPDCLLYHKSQVCGELVDNKETSGYLGRCGKRGGGPLTGCNALLEEVPSLPADMSKRWESCAVVGTHLASVMNNNNGRSIDAHDAVFRVGRPPDSSWGDLGRKIGRRTTIAVLGGRDAAALASQKGGAAIPAQYTVFWHYQAAQYLKNLRDQLQNTTVALLSPSFINWQVEVYGRLRSDLRGLGLGPLTCPRYMSGNLHALLLAMQTCRTVNTFGISISGKSRAASAASTPLAAFSHDAESMLMRLLWMAGALDVCTT